MKHIISVVLSLLQESVVFAADLPSFESQLLASVDKDNAFQTVSEAVLKNNNCMTLQSSFQLDSFASNCFTSLFLTLRHVDEKADVCYTRTSSFLDTWISKTQRVVN